MKNCSKTELVVMGLTGAALLVGLLGFGLLGWELIDGLDRRPAGPAGAAAAPAADTVHVAPVPRAEGGPGFVSAASYEALREERDGWRSRATCARDWRPPTSGGGAGAAAGSELTKMRLACDLHGDGGFRPGGGQDNIGAAREGARTPYRQDD